ncbi:MAG: hypothetical protein CL920_18120 [Deltaproteobacteria bacterium]|nr:hypothetical protein [Deltaproteobacteria bacterium]
MKPRPAPLWVREQLDLVDDRSTNDTLGVEHFDRRRDTRCSLDNIALFTSHQGGLLATSLKLTLPLHRQQTKWRKIDTCLFSSKCLKCRITLTAVGWTAIKDPLALHLPGERKL